MKMRFKLIALLLALVMVLPMVVACAEPVVENTPAEDKVPGAGALTEAPDVVEKTDVVKALLKELLMQSQDVSAEKVEIKGKYKGSVTSSLLTPNPETIYSTDEWVDFDTSILNALVGVDLEAPANEIIKNLILGGAYEDGDEFVAGLINSLDFSKLEDVYGSFESYMAASSASAICYAILSAHFGVESFEELPIEIQMQLIEVSDSVTDLALKIADGTVKFEDVLSFIDPDGSISEAIELYRDAWDGQGNENIEVYFNALKYYIESLYNVFANTLGYELYAGEYICDMLLEYLGSEDGPFAKGDVVGIIIAIYGSAVMNDFIDAVIGVTTANTDEFYYDMVTGQYYKYDYEIGEVVAYAIPEGFELVIKDVVGFTLGSDLALPVYSTYEEACQAREENEIDANVCQYFFAEICAEGIGGSLGLAEIAADLCFEELTSVIDAGEYTDGNIAALVISIVANMMSRAPAESYAQYLNTSVAYMISVLIFDNGVLYGYDDVLLEIVELLKYEDAEETAKLLGELIAVSFDDDNSFVDAIKDVLAAFIGDDNYLDSFFDGIPVTSDLAEVIVAMLDGTYDGTIKFGLAAAMYTALVYAYYTDEIYTEAVQEIETAISEGYIQIETEEDYLNYINEYKQYIMQDIFYDAARIFDEYAYYVTPEGEEPVFEYTMDDVMALAHIAVTYPDDDPSVWLDICGNATNYLKSSMIVDRMHQLHILRAMTYVDPEDFEYYEDYEFAVKELVDRYDEIVRLSVLEFIGAGFMDGILQAKFFVAGVQISYLVLEGDYEELADVGSSLGATLYEEFINAVELGITDAENAQATETITKADVVADTVYEEAYVIGYNAYVEGVDVEEIFAEITLEQVYEYIILPAIFERDDNYFLEELIHVFYLERNIPFSETEVRADAILIRNVYNDAVQDGMTAAQSLICVAFYVYDRAPDVSEGSVADIFVRNMRAIADTISSDDFDFSKDAMYAVMLKQFYGDNAYVDAVIELIGKPGVESVRANLKLLANLIFDGSDADIFVDMIIAAVTGNKAELIDILEELSGVEDYALGSTVLALVAHYLGGFADLDEDIMTVIEAYQIYGITTEAIEELFGEVLFYDFGEVIQVISDALNSGEIDPVHLALDIMVAEGVFEGVAIPEKDYEYYYEELIALLGAFNVFMRQGLNFYDAKNCANVTLLVITDIENIEDYALRLLTVEEKLFEVGSPMWIVYALLSTKAHLEYEDASIVEWDRVLDYIEILVPEMTIQNYAALAALLRDAAETIVTDIVTEIELVTHNELETVYEYTIVGTVSADDIFECELNIVFEMCVSNI